MSPRKTDYFLFLVLFLLYYSASDMDTLSLVDKKG